MTFRKNGVSFGKFAEIRMGVFGFPPSSLRESFRLFGSLAGDDRLNLGNVFFQRHLFAFGNVTL